jgi:ABC-type uncharacterized transport system permease subunit
MIKRFAFATIFGFAIVIIMITITPIAVVAQQHQINSNSQDTNPLSLESIFKLVENSVLQITTKTQIQ